MKRFHPLLKAALFALLLVTNFALPVPAADQLSVSVSRDSSAESAEPGSWAFRLKFNKPVFLSVVKGNTKVFVDSSDEKASITPASKQKDTSLPVQDFVVVSNRGTAAPAVVKIVIKKGLSDASGRLSLSGDFVYEITSMEVISAARITTFFRTNADKGLQLSLLSPISEQDLMKAVRINPGVNRLRVSRQDESAYRITGDFEFNRDYVMEILPEPIDRGRSILKPLTYRFKGPGIKPEIVFKTDRSVIELKGRQLLPLTLSNLSAIKCTLKQVPVIEAADIASRLRESQKSEGKHPVDERLLSYSHPENEKTKLFFRRSSEPQSEVFFSNEAKVGKISYSLPLSFRREPIRGGAWIAELESPENDYTGKLQRLIQITDLSISYKLASHSVLLWVTSLYSGEPLKDVQVMVGTSDGYRYLVGRTNQDGIVKIINSESFPAFKITSPQAVETKPLDLTKAKWAAAAAENDSSFIEFDSLRLAPFSVTQTRNPGRGVESITGSVFTERGVYRTGDPVHFKFVSRVYRDGSIKAPEGALAQIEIVDPRNEVVFSRQLSLNQFGSCHDTFNSLAYSPVGTYNLTVKTKNSEDADETFSCDFMIHDFKEARHFTSISIEKAQRKDDSVVGVNLDQEFLSVNIKGQYYAGGPVKHGRVRWKATLVPSSNTVDGYDKYFFGNQDEETRFLESGESTLSGQGDAIVVIPVDNRLLTGCYGIQVSATVLDVDGEPATEVQAYNPKAKFLVGIFNHPKQVLPGYSTDLSAIVVNKEGKPLQTGKIRTEILQKKYFFLQKKDADGNLNYLWEEGWMKTLGSEQELKGGRVQLPIELNDSGDYLFTVTYEDSSGQYTSRTVFKVGWEEYENWLRREPQTVMRTSGEILLYSNKKQFIPGETANFDFRTPRPSRKALMTVEQGDILDYQLVDMKDKNGSCRVTIRESYKPNAFVSVMAPSGREGFPVYADQIDSHVPTVYFGYLNIDVRTNLEAINVEIAKNSGELKGRPGEKKSVALKVTDSNGKGVVCELAVAVVNEAVLALTRFKTPDLKSLANFSLPLSVFSGDIRQGLIAQDLLKKFSTKPLTGGDEGLGKVGPSVRKDFRPVAFFNPALITDDSGSATIDFTFPDSLTQYRIYVVACTRTAGFSSVEKNITVTQEFSVEPSAPRLLVDGDAAVIPVKVANRTDSQGTAVLDVEKNDNLHVDLNTKSVLVPPQSSAIVKAALSVKESASGVETIKVAGELDSNGHSYRDRIQLPVNIRSRFLPVKKFLIGDFVGKQELDVAVPEISNALKNRKIGNRDFAAYLTMSSTDWSRLAPGLKYLMQYPYGCIEQTSSAIIPLVGMKALIDEGSFPGFPAEKVGNYLTSGIDRLLSMQTEFGGFAYWPGDLKPSWWGTIYAAYALASAHSSGMDVPDDRINKAVSYIRNNLFGENRSQYREDGEWADYWAVLVLAYAGDLKREELQPFFINYTTLKPESRALLLLAAKKTGLFSPKRLADMASNISEKEGRIRNSYRDSTYREWAVRLMAMLECGAGSNKSDSLAGQMLRGIKPDGRWGSTADTGWCLLALSKYYEGRKIQAETAVTFKVSGIGQQDQMKGIGPTAYFELDAKKLLSEGRLTLQSDSKQPVSYNLYLVYPKLSDRSIDASQGFTLSKRIENLNGRDDIAVGDVVRVFLEIGLYKNKPNNEEASFDYLVLEDPLPGGLVAINADLKTEGDDSENSSSGSRDAQRDLSGFTPDYIELKDDSVRAFKNFTSSGTYVFSYLARAVTEGEFWIRESTISMMYDSELYAGLPGRKIRVLPASN
jgi:alpha-2-macroglobulin